MKTRRLLDVVSAAIAGVKSNDKDAQNLLFKDGYLASWSAAISVTVKLPEDAAGLTGVVNGADLARFLSKVNKDDIDIACNEKEWEITSGSMSVKLNTRADGSIDTKVSRLTEELSTLEWSALPSNFHRGLAVCDIPNNTKKTSGVFMGGDLMISTDNIRVNRVHLDKPFSANIWLSQFSLTELRRLKLVFKEYAISRRWLYLRSETDKNGVQLMFACNRLDDSEYEYTVFSDFMDKARDNVFAEGELPDLTHALSIASCFDDSVELADSDVFTNVVTLEFDKSTVTVSSQRKASGAYREKFQYPEGKAPDLDKKLSVQVTSFFLAEACRYSKHFCLTKVGRHTLILFTATDFQSAVMVLTA